MIIDCHNHPDWLGHNFPKYLDNMDRYGIDKTWLLSWECPADEYNPVYYKTTPGFDERGPIPFARCISYAERAPDRFIPGYAPDPRRPDAIDRLEAAIDIYGIKICGEIKLRMMYDNPDAIALYQYCGKRGLPVVVHIEYPSPTGVTYPRRSWWYGGTIEAFERAVQQCPETIFIGHAPGFWAHISGDGQTVGYPKGKIVPGGKVVEMLRRYPNLYADISAGSGHNALSRDPEFARSFLFEFQDKLLYARDCMDNTHQELLRGYDLPQDVQDKLFFGNALRLVPLD